MNGRWSGFTTTFISTLLAFRWINPFDIPILGITWLSAVEHSQQHATIWVRVIFNDSCKGPSSSPHWPCAIRATWSGGILCPGITATLHKNSLLKTLVLYSGKWVTVCYLMSLSSPPAEQTFVLGVEACFPAANECTESRFEQGVQVWSVQDFPGIHNARPRTTSSLLNRVLNSCDLMPKFAPGNTPICSTH